MSHSTGNHTAGSAIDRGKRRFWRAIGMVTMGVVMLLVIAAIIVPHFVQARWGSSGVPVNLQIALADAQTGEAIPGAEVVVWRYNDWRFPVNASSAGDISATTDAHGNCIVHSHFPGSGIGGKGRLRVNSTIRIRADGYEPYQQQTAALLGSTLDVTEVFQTNVFPIKIEMQRR